ncbi:MAG TPA: hypothetical protein PKE27_10845 [Povalibacter sp.]|uniref:hypothetical protein n=1 Tax=Povalibacter sp. TaxID=1962978 RepID=UPI002BD4419D|nr:hypothetical protein [Povalibacter sp.]HMN45064.1 hypothetical protein [Povalibacter sp.]
MKRRKAGKALERVARAICDSDEFVAHAAGIAALYRRERELEGSEQRRELRNALKALQRHTEALAGWLDQSQPGRTVRPEQTALKLIGETGGDNAIVQAWATRVTQAAAQTVDDLKSARPDAGKAIRTAAEALKATFEHHKLKWSATITKGQAAPGLALLCAIAHDAGDRDLTPVEAHNALRAPAANQ